jgi:hypothetical protein
MPVINDLDLKLETGEVLRRQGFKKKNEIRPEIETIIFELIAEVENNGLLKPAVAYEIFSGEEMDRRQLSLKHVGDIRAGLLTSLIPDMKEIAVLVCTIGPGLEEKVTAYSCNGETLRGLLLDGIGSAAVDSLAVEACAIIAKEASSRGYQISSPISPGMPCLPLTEQEWLLKLVHAEHIGVSLTRSAVMVPRKSTSMVVGLGYNMETLTQTEICARCSLHSTCQYKYDHA